MPDGLADVRVPEPEVAGVDAGEDLPDELCPRGHGEIQRALRVPQDVHPERNPDVAHQLPDDGGHGRYGLRLNLSQVGEAELVGEHHRVHPPLLQGTQIPGAHVQNPGHPLLFVVPGVSRHRLHMAHGDDRLLGSQHLLQPTHDPHPFALSVPRPGLWVGATFLSPVARFCRQLRARDDRACISSLLRS